MKTTTLLIAGLFSVLSASASAHDNGYRHDRHDARVTHNAINHYNEGFREQRHNIGRAERKAAISYDRALRYQRREQHLLARGDLRGAREARRASQHEFNKVHYHEREASHNRNVIRYEKQRVDHVARVAALNGR
jgi:hypothetical protein